MPELKIVFGSQFKRDLKKQFLLLATAEWAEILYCLTRRNYPPNILIISFPAIGQD